MLQYESNVEDPRDESEYTVSFLPQATKVNVRSGETLEVAARRADIEVPAPCKGAGFCGMCKVRVLQGVQHPTDCEFAHISLRELTHGTRLACQTHPSADTIVALPSKQIHLTVDGDRYPYLLSPAAYRAYVRGSADDLPPEIARCVWEIAGDGTNVFTLYGLNDAIVRADRGKEPGGLRGLAVCGGAESVKGWLFDLETGRELAFGNARIIGSDGHRSDHIASAIKRLARTLSVKTDNRVDSIIDVVTTGTDIAADTRLNRTARIRRVVTVAKPVADIAIVSAIATGSLAHRQSAVLGLTPVPWVLVVREDSAWLAWCSGWKLKWGLFRTTSNEPARKMPSLEASQEKVSDPVASLPTLRDAIGAVVNLRANGLIDRRGKFLNIEAAGKTLAVEAVNRRGKPVLELEGDQAFGASVLQQAHVREVQRMRAILSALWSQALVAADTYPELLEEVALVGEYAASLPLPASKECGILPATVPVQRFPRAWETGIRLGLLSSVAADEMSALAARCSILPEYRFEESWAQRLYLDFVE